MTIALLAPLQPLELLLATKDVCPGVNGMVSWYIECWDMIGNVLTFAYQQMLTMATCLSNGQKV